nr:MULTISPECIES: HNH endonuclease [Rhodococcus]
MQGDWCPGYLRAPHSSSDLTADHIVDIQHGGSPTGPLQVLCRSCNSRKAGQRWP